MIKEYADLDAVALTELVSTGQVSAREVVETAIAAAEELNSKLNAIVIPTFETALEQTKNISSGPLAGVPFLIKDMVAVKGVPCNLGSRLWADMIPDFDSEIIKRYRRAGLILLGQSNQPELGLTATTEGAFSGKCHNPWNLDHSPGGSSGGSAAAVAARIVPAAHAADGGGSIRGPASCCGLVGLKPSRGRTTLAPSKGEGWGGASTAHAVTRSIRDSALILDVSHGAVPGDPYHPPYFGGSYFKQHRQDPGKLKIALDLKPITGKPVHPECLKAVDNTARQLENLGHQIVVESPIFDRQRLLKVSADVVVASIAQTVDSRAAELGRSLEKDDIEPYTWLCVNEGRKISAGDYIQGINFYHEVGRTIADFFSDYDLILSPTHLTPPPLLGWIDTQSDDLDTYRARMEEFWGFTSLYNASGSPAISLPLHETKAGLPIGVQLAADFGNELLLLQIGHQLEQAMPWIHRKPMVCTK